MDRHSGGGPPPHLRGRPVSGLEAAHATEYFEPFLNATTLKSILGYHRSMCELLHLKPNVFTQFYPKLRANLTSWKAKALWKKFDARASHKCYGKGKACAGTRVLVIGGGPCGLRSAIEAQLLGAKVVVIEKRDRLSRNNVLHLWPFVIEDLRMLGAKKFFGKFCAGSIDHISIRQIQCILLKVALLLGVEVHTEVSFEKLIEPNATEKTGWRAEIVPENHPVAQYEFDVILGADGKRNTLQGFKRKEFRGKLAIAITANFINKKTEAEARVEEISGVAFIFNQKFFKDLQEETRIDLENIVYYKDDTHYFVMTAKKASLLEKGVIKQDLNDTEKLLAQDNVNRDALQNYAREAADFSTNYQLPNLEFAVNHYGQPDVAMFDFTSMYAAEYASKAVERNGYRLLMILVGDSLLEPFWPTGSGCARGFLSSFDAAWAIRSWSSGQMTPLEVLAERESIYRLLAQTTPDNLNKDWKSYTLDPTTRYPNLNKTVVTPHQTVCLYDTDNPDSIDKMKRASLEAASRLEHVPKKRRRGIVDKEALLNWLKEQLCNHEDLAITDIASVFRDGKTLCAIIHHYRPDLMDYGAIKDSEPAARNQLAMDILEKDLGIPPFMTGEEITNTEDNLAMAAYLTQVYDTFRGEIPHIKHPKLKTKSSSKIPKSISKYLPKNFTLPFQTELLEKLTMIERQFSQTTILTSSTSQTKPSKMKGGKGGGDHAPIADRQKCQKINDIKCQKVNDSLSKHILVTKACSDVTEKKLGKLIRDDLKIKNIKKRTLKHDNNSSKPLKTLSEKTFLSGSIESLKRIRKKKCHVSSSKLEFFDLTYVEDVDSDRKRKIRLPKPTLENTEAKKVRSSESSKSDKKVRKIRSGSTSQVDKNIKKTKSKNVLTTPASSANKILKRKKLKLKKSKLSVIPENKDKEDAASEKTRTLSVSKSTTTNCNVEQKNAENKALKNMNDITEKPATSVTDLVESFNKLAARNSLSTLKAPVKLFRCETFVHNSFDSLELPKIPSPVSLGSASKTKTSKVNFILPNEPNEVRKIRTHPSLSKIEPLNNVGINSSKTVTKNKKKSAERVLELKYFNPLQAIRKHLTMKRSKLKDALSKASKFGLKKPLSYKRNTQEATIFQATKKDSTTSFSSSTHSFKIQVIQKSSSDKIICQAVEYKSSLNVIKITSRSSNVRRGVSSRSYISMNKPYRGSSVGEKCLKESNGSGSKHIKQIFENKERFLNTLSSQYGSVKGPVIPGLDRRRFPDYGTNKPNKRKLRTGTVKETPLPTPADAQIINSLATAVNKTSNFKETCRQKSRNSYDYQKRHKFSLESSVRNGVPEKRHSRPESCRASLKQESKLRGKNCPEEKIGLKMEFYDEDDSLSPQMYTRVQRWISQNDFKADEVKKDPEGETLFTCDVTSDITSVTRAHAKKKGEYDDIKVEQRTDVIKCESPISSSQEDFAEFVKQLKDGIGANTKDSKNVIKPVTKFSQYNMKSVSAPPANFSVIVEGEESELPESNKRSEFSFKSIKTTNYQPSIPNVQQQSRPSSRHKRHAEVMVPKPCSIDRKQRKRRTLERIGPSVPIEALYQGAIDRIIQYKLFR